MSLLSTAENVNPDVAIRPDVDSYISMTVGVAPSEALTSTPVTLSTGAVPLATRSIAENFRNPISALNFNLSMPNYLVSSTPMTLDVDGLEKSCLFFKMADYGDYSMRTPTEQAMSSGISFSTLPYNETISTTFGTISTALTLADQKEITQKSQSSITWYINRVDNVHTLMKKMVSVSPTIGSSLGSLYDQKEVPFGGQSFLNHTFIVLDEEFTRIISKNAQLEGAFVNRIMVSGNKVHVLAVPVDTTKNIIPFRAIDVSGV